MKWRTGMWVRWRRRVRRPSRISLIVVGATVMLGSSAALAGVSTSEGSNSVSVSVSTATSLPASALHGGIGPASSGDTASQCTYTGISSTPAAWAGVPDGPGGTLYLIACPGWTVGFKGSGLLWVPAGSPGPAAAGSAVPSSVLAAQAERTVSLPSPSIGLNPGASNNVVMLPTWLWLQPAIWHPYRATATAGALSASVTVTPTQVRWNMGDGNSIVCDGPGTQYRSDLPAASQATSCSYTYHRTSIGQPSVDGTPDDGAYIVTAAVTWSVSWAASDGSSGTLPQLVTQSSADVRVQQVQSVDAVG